MKRTSRTRKTSGARRGPALRLSVQYAVAADGQPSRARLRRWALAALHRDAEVTLRLVGAREGRALNRRFRGRDYATNVLTFAYDDTAPLTGDIVICLPVVEREARRQDKGRDAHLAHLVVHGMLHLQGYDHQGGKEALAMERLETGIVMRLGYPDPYAG
ncbi:MAG TPA: rRNA maturation RNase YbeY [Burkholderiales bacterium]|jgi:probable rRNA maturation factor|nr:rRNA maturation RNase YbeY [Burkholderiales bacterium]